MNEQPELLIGSEFIGYRIEEVIGRGGMGVVYRAYDLRLKRAVALKLIAPELALDERFRKRFARESELAMSLEHPNVVPIHDAGDVDGRLYLAMRLVAGTDLRTLLRSQGALEPAHALAICRQVANALDMAHARGLVHRDVKPSNVLLDESRHVYLADFGLTRGFDEQVPPGVKGRSIGTPAYLAPEQIEAGPVDGRADVYALGCVLFECLTGSPPYRGGSTLEVAWAHLQAEPPAASRSRPRLDEAIDGVIARAMAKEPDQRYATCGAFASAAESALGFRQPSSLRRRAVLVGLALVALAASAAAAFVLYHLHAHAGPPIVRADTLVRIDPTENVVQRVIDVAPLPIAVAEWGRSAWVYSSVNVVSQIDTHSNRVVRTTHIGAAPVEPQVVSGPVLSANALGAWLIGADPQGRSALTLVRASGRTRTYPLDRTPQAVVARDGFVWVVADGPRADELLQLDPATGRLIVVAGFPASSHVDSLAVGLGAAWLVSSSTATLYRVLLRSGDVAHRDLGTRAGRPMIESGRVWVGLSDGSGTVLVDPDTLWPVLPLGCCAIDSTFDVAAYGSTWMADVASGNVVRWDGVTYGQDNLFQLTPPPSYDGDCLTSLAAGGGAVWVTVVASVSETCSP
jgi:hypothetical protein